VKIFFWRDRRAIVCREAVDLMVDYLDDALPPAGRRRLEAHLSACSHCSEYLAQLRITIDALGHVTPEDLSDEVLDELVGLYRSWREG
jgi:anti-sigma factor RsiW